MFKAIKKGQAPADGPGTLTALWGKKQPAAAKEEGPGGATPAPAGPSAAQEADADLTPAAGHQGGQAAAPATGGDVAIAAVPDPSPEPVLAAAAAPQPQPPQQQEQQQQQEQAEPQPVKASGSASGGGAEKKRKRAAAEAFSEEQAAKLAALFAKNEYASKEEKAALAQELGVEYAQVDKWFQKQRKKQREETGAAPKRGRPSKASGGSSGKGSGACAAAEPGAEAAADEAEAAAEPAAAQQQQQAEEKEEEQQEQQQEQQAEGMEVDGEPAAAAEVEAAEAPAAEAMAVDGPVEPAAAETDATPAPAAKEHQQQPPAEPAAAAVADTDASPGGSGGKPAASAGAGAPAATPATAPQQRIISAEDKAALVAELESEQAALQTSGLAPPLQPLPAAGADGEAPPARLAFADGRLAAAVAGQRAPLSQLAAALLPLFHAPDSEAPVEEAVLRSRIIDLAARKSFGPKDGGSGLVDALEDGAPEHLWQWELRDLKHLPKELRPAAQRIKKRAAGVADRLTALSAALRALQAHAGGKAPHKLCKALDALGRVKTLAQLEAAEAEEAAAAAAKKAAKKASTAAKASQTAEEKARLKAEKEAAKAAEKAAKEAEKAAEKQAKEAEKAAEKASKEAEKAAEKAVKEEEKERQRAEKKAEKERKQKEAEDAKQVKKTGMKAAETKRASNVLAAFLGKGQSKTPASAAKPADSSAAAPASKLGDGSGGAGPASQQASQAGSQAQQQQQPQQATTGKRERGYAELFPKPVQGPELRSLPPQPSRAEEMDAAAGQPFSWDQAAQEWQALLAGMKRRRREATAQPRPLGLPPSWARKRNAEELAQACLDKLAESGVDVSAVPLWRRKLIQFNSFTGEDTEPRSRRPPYYGSCRPNPAVGPRRFLGRAEARWLGETLDYEVESDADWEEEPEDAEELGADMEDSEMGGGEEDEEDDSFVCADGYLSADEGVQVDLEDDAGMELDMPQGLPEGAAAAAGVDPGRLLAMQQLEVQIERARRTGATGKVLVISRLPGEQAPAPNCVYGDASLLAALAAEVLLPGVRVGLPEDPAAEQAATTAAGAAGAPGTAAKQASPAAAAGAAAAGAAATGGDGKKSAGRPRERPDDLLPALMRMVQAAPRTNKAKIAEDFVAAHPARKVPKKWVQDSLKAHADWQGGSKGWVLKPSGAALAAGADPSALAAFEAAAAAAGGGGAPGAAGPAAEAPGTAAAGQAAGQAAGEAAPPASGTVEPTPAATKAAAGGGIERFFAKKQEPMATPAVPSALRPNAPPSELKAPGRLVTTTAAGADAAAAPVAAGGPVALASPGPLAVPDSVRDTANPFWHQLLQHIEGGDCACSPPPPAGAGNAAQQQSPRPQFLAAFQPAALQRLLPAMPAAVLSALVTGVAAEGSTAASKAAYLRCLEAAVAALAAAAEEGAGDASLSASQQVWQPRGAPPPASLAELAREQLLLPALQAAVAAGVDAPEGSSAGRAATLARGIAQALLSSDAARAAVAAAAAESSPGLLEGLQALASSA